MREADLRWWSSNEVRLGAVASAVLAMATILLFPDFSQSGPGAILKRTVERPDCPELTGTRSVDLAQELTKAKPDFTNANLTGADLSGSSFEQVSFFGAKLDGALIAGTLFDDADLRCADMYAVRGNGETRFLISDLRAANLNDAELPGASFAGSKLVGADLSGARLAGADFDGADLTAAVLVGTSLEGAILTETDLSLSDYRPRDAPDPGSAAEALGLDQLRPGGSVVGIRLLADALAGEGLKDEALALRASAARWERHATLNDADVSWSDWIKAQSERVYLGWISADGTEPLRPVWILAVATLLFAALSLPAFTNPTRQSRVAYRVLRADGSLDEEPMERQFRRCLAASVLFSLANALVIATPMLAGLQAAERALGAVNPYVAHGRPRAFGIVQALFTAFVIVSFLAA